MTDTLSEREKKLVEAARVVAHDRRVSTLGSNRDTLVEALAAYAPKPEPQRPRENSDPGTFIRETLAYEIHQKFKEVDAKLAAALEAYAPKPEPVYTMPEVTALTKEQVNGTHRALYDLYWAGQRKTLVPLWDTYNAIRRATAKTPE